MTGIAFGCIGFTTAFGGHVRNAKSLCSPSTGFAFAPRVPVQGRQTPANAKGAPSGRPNHRSPFGGSGDHSEKDVTGTRHRNLVLSQGFQKFDVVLRTLMTSDFWTGGKPHRITSRFRAPLSLRRTTAASRSGYTWRGNASNSSILVSLNSSMM